jgi:nitroreductase
MQDRTAAYPILDLLLNRWSARAMSGESITHQELMSLFEAARWAPSSFNNQPWRFIYAHRATAHWERLFNLVMPGNQEWMQNAAVLMVVVSANTFEKTGKDSRTHSFDTGAAWENLALQGNSMQLVVHAIEGFDYDKTRVDLTIPEDYTVEAMIAIGKPGPLYVLSSTLQAREELSDRKPVSSFIYEGTYK